MKLQIVELDQLAAGLFRLAELTTERLTVRQALAFILVAREHARSGSITMSDLRAETDGVVGQALERTFGVFLEPTRHYPNALAWVFQESDSSDRRKKYLRLTKDGEHAVAILLCAFAGDLSGRATG